MLGPQEEALEPCTLKYKSMSKNWSALLSNCILRLIQTRVIHPNDLWEDLMSFNDRFEFWLQVSFIEKIHIASSGTTNSLIVYLWGLDTDSLIGGKKDLPVILYFQKCLRYFLKILQTQAILKLHQSDFSNMVLNTSGLAIKVMGQQLGCLWTHFSKSHYKVFKFGFESNPCGVCSICFMLGSNTDCLDGPFESLKVIEYTLAGVGTKQSPELFITSFCCKFKALCRYVEFGIPCLLAWKSPSDR